MGFDLPYFDQIIERLEEQPDSELARAFRAHVHWGYFAAPDEAGDTLEEYVVAAEDMTRQVCLAADIADGAQVLDVGCGFGGTVDFVNQQHTGCDLTGLNIDVRQVARASSLVTARDGNSLRFIVGDACKLPIADDSVDAVLAVECAFHFPSRKQFFREARRVLRPGGTLALTDFVLGVESVAGLTDRVADDAAAESRFYGTNTRSLSSKAYERLGRGSGFTTVNDRDITANTLPTYPAMRRVYDEADLPDGAAATDYLEGLATDGLVGYHVLAFTD